MSEYKPQSPHPQQSWGQPSGQTPLIDSGDAPPMAYPVYPQVYSTRPVQSGVYHSIPVAENAPYDNPDTVCNVYWILFLAGFACPTLFGFGIGGLCCPTTRSEKVAGIANLIAFIITVPLLCILVFWAYIGWVLGSD